MRVIAGKFRSRQLKSLKDLELRPTSDRLRETLFNILGELVVDSFFIDAFAGTGAVGIEAVSRGASEVVFIENHKPTAALIKRNLELLEIRAGTRVFPVDAMKGLETLAREKPADNAKEQIVFLDPPYANAADYDRVLDFLGSAPFLRPGALVIAEHGSKFDLPGRVNSLERVRTLRQGDATLSFYRRTNLQEDNLPTEQ